MKFVVGIILAIATNCRAIPLLQEQDQAWNGFLANFNPRYKDSTELEYRKQIFLTNLQAIQKHNTEYDLGQQTYRKGVNQFTDKTHLETRPKFSQLNATEIRDHNKQGQQTFEFEDDIDIPESIDWRDLGAVKRVKDQGACDSSWAFSAIGALEAQYFFATNSLRSLSVAQLVDCSKRNSGCDGGNAPDAFQDLQEMGGLAKRKYYPHEYKPRQQKCEEKGYARALDVTGYKMVPPSEEALMQAVALQGPIAARMQSTENFNSYESGVFFDELCSEGNTDIPYQAVLVVGYGSSDGKDYWIVKNSWGKRWGEKGYMRVARNKNNHCHIASAGVYPLIDV